MSAIRNTPKLLSIAICATVLSGASLSYAAAPATAQQWFDVGKEVVKENRFEIPTIRRARNVIDRKSVV